MNNIYYAPPVVFLLVLAALWLLGKLFSRLAMRVKKTGAGEGASYACGEDNYDHLEQPDYSSFFPYAFFFALAHVATLMITTVPLESVGIFAMAMLYIAGAATGLCILLRRQG